MILFATPLSFISTGIQTILAWYLGNNSDEGIDARTTHHMFGVFLSIMTIWPILSIFTSIYIIDLISIEMNVFTLIIGSFVAFVAFQFIKFHVFTGYDLWNDFTMSLKKTEIS